MDPFRIPRQNAQHNNTEREHQIRQPTLVWFWWQGFVFRVLCEEQVLLEMMVVVVAAAATKQKSINNFRQKCQLWLPVSHIKMFFELDFIFPFTVSCFSPFCKWTRLHFFFPRTLQRYYSIQYEEIFPNHVKPLEDKAVKLANALSKLNLRAANKN